MEVELLFDADDRSNDVLGAAPELREMRRILIYVLFSGGDIHPPSSELLRLRALGTPGDIDVSGRFEDDARVMDGCGIDVVYYPVTGFPNGEYELLHPRSAIPDGFTWGRGDMPWELIDGEEVARTRFVIGEATSSADAGIGDAGP